MRDTIKDMLYYTCLLVCCMAFTISPYVSHCQVSKNDSLRTVASAPKTSDTSKVLAYCSLAWEYKNRNTNPDSILYYANKGYEIAKKINFPKGIALCKSYFGMAYILVNKYNEAVDNLNDALIYYEAMPPSKELNELYHNIGLQYYMQTKFDPAIEYFKKSKQSAIEIDNKSRLARACYYLGDIYNDKGTFDKALQEYLKALELYERGGKKGQASNCLTNIATVYAQLKDFKNAKKFIDRSLDEFSKASNTEEVFQNYVNIGIVYGMMNEDDKALKLFTKGEQLTDSLKDEYWNTVFLVNIAEIYTQSNKYEQAITTYKKVLQRNETVQEINFELAARSGIGAILLKQGKKKEGIEQKLEALRLMKENGMKRLVMETTQELSSMYELDGNYKQALTYDRIADLYKDSIFNENSNKKIQQLQYDYELEKKEQKIEQLSKTKELQIAKSARQVTTSWSLAGGLVLLTIIILLMIRNRRFEVRRRREIQKQNEVLEQQAAKLVELNGFKDKTFSVLSHDLRGPVSSITLTIQMLNSDDISKEEYDMLKLEINNQLASLNLLLDNVLLWAKSYIQDNRAAHPATVNIHTLANQNVDLIKNSADGKQITLQNNVHTNATAYCDEGQINIVIRNLIMNAVKYTDRGGNVTLSSKIADGKLRISIADTGVGMTKEQLNVLFNTSTGKNTYGTEGEKGIGLGLLICSEFVRVNNGSIHVDSELGVGSTFTLVLPLSKA